MAYQGIAHEHFDALADANAIMPDCKLGGRWVWNFSRPESHFQWLDQDGEHLRMAYTSLPELWRTCQQYIEWLQIQPGETVLDIGAYCGLSTIVFSRVVGPGGYIFAVEPDRENFAALRRNTRDYKNITCSSCAISGRRGVLRFKSEGSFSSGFSLSRGVSYMVPTMRLQDVTGLHVDAIKIDAEGAEAIILGGAADWLREMKPRLLVECHTSVVATSEVLAQALRIVLEKIGYECQLIPPFSWEAWHVLAMPKWEVRTEKDG